MSAQSHPSPAGKGVRILGVGHVAVDLIFEVEQIPTRPSKTPASRHRQGVGGMTANACVAAARLGADVRFFSPVGDDAYADVFAQHLRAEGIDASGLVRVPGQGSSVSAILVDARGERAIINCRGSALAHAPPCEEVPALHAALEDVGAFDVVLADPRCPHWAQAALSAARRAGRLSVFDADVAPLEDLQRLVGLAHWAVFSLPGLQILMQRELGAGSPLTYAAQLRQGLQMALAAGARAAAVTLGEHGLMWCDAQGEGGSVSPFAVAPVVDTLGAGDVFHGALAVALAEHQPVSDALAFASAAAALKCLRPGGVQGAPRRDELIRALACGSH